MAVALPRLVSPEEAELARLKLRLRLRLQRYAGTATTGAYPYAADPVGWMERRLGAQLWSLQRQIAEAVRDHRRVAVHSCFESGKALALDTPLPTPTGWTTMGAVQPGDWLLDEQGQPCPVRAVSPVEVLPAYRVTFSDRSSLVASGAHLWTVFDIRRQRNKRDWRDHWDEAVTLSTEKMAAAPFSGPNHRWKIPTIRPLDTGEAWSLPWEPYAFGAWLGDGTTVRWELTAHVDDAPYLAAAVGGTILPGRRPTTRLVRPPGRVTLSCPSRVLQAPKHIPVTALRAPYADRLALLRGLMDTDGCLGNRGSVEIAVCSQVLADGIAELVTSMGWVAWRSERPAKLYGRVCGTSYRLAFRPDVAPFSLPRKRDAWLARVAVSGDVQAGARTQRTIVSIERVPDQPVKCVEVDSPRHLYLAGRAMIPTHNSWLAARIVAWWLDQHATGEAFAVTTATTGAQVRAILWRELRRAHAAGGLAGRLNQTEWWLQGEMVAFGRKPADYDPEAFQGLHTRYMLVVIDEAAGVPEDIFRAAAGLTANLHSRVLAIGNPSDAQSYFATLCKPGSGWHVIGIDALQTPNFTDGEGLPQAVLDQLISPTYAAELADEVGEDSAVYVSKVRGQFPENTTDGVVLLSWVRQCQRLEPPPADAAHVPVELGMDCGAGGDETNLRERRGMVAGRVWRQRTPNWADAVALALDALDATGATAIKIDEIGIGWGVKGRLEELRQEGRHAAAVYGVNVGQASTAPERFPKLRDQLWWEVGRELSRTHGWDLAAVDDTTIAQLVAPTYRRDSAGRIQVEPKADTRKRLRRSPDDADALLLAYYVPAPGRIAEVL
jgi:hypothetical protein